MGLLGGVLYFLVDYGVFYRLLGTRQVVGADPFLFLLWLSMSYGFTNFVWIWLWLDRDRRLLEWSLFIPAGWIAVSLLAQNFGGPLGEIAISRGTDSYHGVMALILFVGYGGLIAYNLKASDERRAPLAWLLAIGILVQLSWEAILLITGIRAQGLGAADRGFADRNEPGYALSVPDPPGGEAAMERSTGAFGPVSWP